MLQDGLVDRRGSLPELLCEHPSIFHGGILPPEPLRPEPILSDHGPMSEFAEAVYRVVGSTEPGELLTYGQVAALAGRPSAARAVGNLMAHSEGLPWWRVLCASGRLVPGKEIEQRQRLEREGAGPGQSRLPRLPSRKGAIGRPTVGRGRR
jgi:alkylated DNA nucleotide flippase Atl1